MDCPHNDCRVISRRFLIVINWHDLIEIKRDYYYKSIQSTTTCYHTELSEIKERVNSFSWVNNSNEKTVKHSTDQDQHTEALDSPINCNNGITNQWSVANL